MPPFDPTENPGPQDTDEVIPPPDLDPDEDDNDGETDVVDTTLLGDDV